MLNVTCVLDMLSPSRSDPKQRGKSDIRTLERNVGARERERGRQMQSSVLIKN